MTGADVPLDDPVREFWEDVIADMEATAEEYEEEGWEALALHPGETTPLAGEGTERPGFDVLLPDNEFEELLSLIEVGVDFSAYEVYSTAVDDVVFLVVAMQDAATENAVLFPLYYRPGTDSAGELREHVEATGEVRSHLRRLREDEIVTFEHEEPELFFAEAD